MREPTNSVATPPKVEDARDLQAKLYRDIGISAVAAALRFTTQPAPVDRLPEAPTLRPEGDRKNLAA